MDISEYRFQFQAGSFLEFPKIYVFAFPVNPRVKLKPKLGLDIGSSESTYWRILATWDYVIRFIQKSP